MRASREVDMHAEEEGESNNNNNSNKRYTMGDASSKASKQSNSNNFNPAPIRTAVEITALRLDPREWEKSRNDPYKASPESVYEYYDVPVDHNEGDRATRIKIHSFKRPHMRALHCAWFSFFMAFTIWFAPAPLLGEIKETLGLSKKQVWTSSIANDVMAIVMRIAIGPLCDKYGARIPMAVVLMLASIPTAMVGLVETATGLIVVRLFIGIAGSSFVMAQFWPSRMFSREIAGTANGIVGGWGNLGGAFTQLFVGGLLFPLFKMFYEEEGDEDDAPELAWRKICVIPAVIAFCWGMILPFVSDDAPMGNYDQMKKTGAMDRVFLTTALRKTATVNTWILYIQYACSFGVELAMNNGAVLYYKSEYGLTTERAATIGFIYSSMNIVMRALGGYASDRLNLHVGMRGRLWLVTVLLLLEGIMIMVFSFTTSLSGSVFVMCCFSIFTQAAEGAIYGIVPYVSRLYTGSVAGLVGAGGNAGSVVYGFGFRSLPYRDAFIMMGTIVMCSSFLSVFVKIPCHAGMLFGEDNNAVIQARQRFLERRAAQENNNNNNEDEDNNIDEEEEEKEATEAVLGRTASPPPPPPHYYKEKDVEENNNNNNNNIVEANHRDYQVGAELEPVQGIRNRERKMHADREELYEQQMQVETEQHNERQRIAHMEEQHKRKILLQAEKTTTTTTTTAIPTRNVQQQQQQQLEQEQGVTIESMIGGGGSLGGDGYDSKSVRSTDSELL